MLYTSVNFLKQILSFCIFLLGLTTTLLAQTNYYSKSTGALNLPSTWGTNTDGTGTTPANFTTNNQVFNVVNSNPGTLSALWTVSGTGSKIVVGDGLTAQSLTTGGFTLSGTVDVNNLGTLTIGSVSTFTLGTAATGSTVVYNRAGGQPVVAGTYDNLTIGASLTGTAIGNLIVNGTLTINTNATLDLGTNLLSGTLATVTNNGTISTSVPTITSVTPIPSGRTWSGTINYAANAQTVVAGTYANLSLSNTSGATNTSIAGGNIEVTTLLTSTSNGIFDLGIYTLSGTLTTANITGVLRTSNTSAVPLPTGVTWGGVVRYNLLTGGQTIVPGTYNNLSFNNTSGTNTAGGDFAVNSTFTVNSSTIINMGPYALSGAGTFTNNGTILTQNTSAAPLPSGKTWTGTVEYNGTGAQTVVTGTYSNLIISTARIGSPDITLASGTININSTFTNTATGIGSFITTGNTVNYAVSGTVLASIPYYNLTLSSNSVAGGNLTVNGTLTTTAGVTLDLGTNLLSGSLTTITNNGTISTIVPTATSTTPIPAGKTWGGTVIYNADAGSQTVVAGTYNNLTLNNSSGINAAGGTLTVSGTLITTSNGTFDLGTNLLTGSLTTITNGGTISTAVPTATSTTPIPTGKTWNGTVVYASTTGAQTVVTGTYSNLTVNNTSGVNTAGGDLTVNGTLTTTATATLNIGTNLLSVNLITNNGTIQTQNTSANPIPSAKTWGGTVEYNGTGAQTIVAGTFTNIIISGARAGATLTLESGTLSISGTFTNTATGIGSFTTTGNTVNYNKSTGGQAVTVLTYNNLTLSNSSGINTVAADLTVNGTFTTTAGGTFNLGTNLLSGTFTATNLAGILQTQNTSATPIPTGKTWGGTVEYNGTGAQTIVAGTFTNIILSTARTGSPAITLASGTITLSGNFTYTATGIGSFTTTGNTITYSNTTGGQTVAGITYNNLTLNNTSGTNTVGGALTVNGTLTTTAGGKLNLGTNQLTGTLATITNNGTIQTQNTSTTPYPTAKTWGGTGTVEYNGTVTQTVIAGTYANIIVSGARSSGLLRLEAGGTFNISGSFTFTATGFGSFLANNNTVNYTSTTGNQTIAGITYNNLTLSNSSNTNTVSGGTLTVNGTLTTTAGGTLNLGTNRLSGTLATITNNGTISTAVPTATSATPIPTGKTWGGTVVYAVVTGAQTVVNGTYNNLTLSNTSGTNTAGGALTVNGTLTTTAGGTIDLVQISFREP